MICHFNSQLTIKVQQPPPSSKMLSFNWLENHIWESRVRLWIPNVSRLSHGKSKLPSPLSLPLTHVWRQSLSFSLFLPPPSSSSSSSSSRFYETLSSQLSSPSSLLAFTLLLLLLFAAYVNEIFFPFPSPLLLLSLSPLSMARTQRRVCIVSSPPLITPPSLSLSLPFSFTCLNRD